MSILKIFNLLWSSLTLSIDNSAHLTNSCSDTDRIVDCSAPGGSFFMLSGIIGIDLNLCRFILFTKYSFSI